MADKTIPGAKGASFERKEDMTPVAGETAASWQESIFSSRLLFVMGKGGVGKTTIGIALALAASRRGKKTLLAEIGDSDAIGNLFLGEPLKEIPREMAPDIWGARINPRAELEAYVLAHVSPGFIANKIIHSRLFDYLFEAAPGLKEVMSLGRIWRWESGDRRISDAAFDLIIVDAPATGHALSLLSLPEMLINMIRIGPVAAQIRRLEGLLKDPQKTRLVFVVLPEELPINETVELFDAARDRLSMPVAGTFVNCVYPLVFSPEETAHLLRLEHRLASESGSEEAHCLVSSAIRLIRQRGFQRKHIDAIRSRSGGHVLEVPYCFTSDLSLADIEALSYF